MMRRLSTRWVVVAWCRFNYLSGWESMSLTPLFFQGIFFLYSGGVLLGYWCWIAPLQQQAQVLQEQLQHKTEQLQADQQAAVQSTLWMKKIKQVKREVHALLQRQQVIQDLPAVFKQLSEEAEHRGLVITSWIPLTRIKHAGYVIYPVQLTIAGAYAPVMQWLLQLTRLSFVQIGQHWVMERRLSQIYLTMHLRVQRELSTVQVPVTPTQTTKPLVMTSDPFSWRTHTNEHAKKRPFQGHVVTLASPHTLMAKGMVSSGSRRWVLLQQKNGFILHATQGSWIGDYQVVEIQAHTVRLMKKNGASDATIQLKIASTGYEK